MSLFIDSGAGLVLSIWFVLALVLNSENNFIFVKLAIWVWCSYNERTNCLGLHGFLLTNHLHGQGGELWPTADITM